MERCEKHWADCNQGLPFEALIGGIIGLASILSPIGSVQPEVDIIRHAESILTDQAVLAEPTVEVLAALFLRGVYLRATARPHVTWLLSCVAMHMSEALGLHKYHNFAVGREDKFGNHSDIWSAEACSCLFWMTCAVNSFLSHELGRSPVLLHEVTRKIPFPLSDNSGAAVVCRLGSLLPLKIAESESESEQTQRLNESLDTIERIASDQPFLKLLAAEVCFSLYRRIRVNNKYNIITKLQSHRIASIGRAAVQSANLLLHKGQAWWNMIGTLFQFACVLISMDSPDSLVDLQYAVKTINRLKTAIPVAG